MLQLWLGLVNWMLIHSIVRIGILDYDSLHCKDIDKCVMQIKKLLEWHAPAGVHIQGGLFYRDVEPLAWCYGRSWWALDIDECTMQNRNILEQNQPCRVVLLTVIVNDIMMLPYPMLA